MKLISSIVACIVLIATTAQAAAPGAVGAWRGSTSGIDIAQCSDRSKGELCGKLVWLSNPLDAAGRAIKDVHNPDASRRTQPLIGMLILTGFRPDGEGRWTGGRIYSPDDGHTYDSKLTLVGRDQLKLEGCFLIVCKEMMLRRIGQ
ncbi:MAG: DUF2147 domain-containing protein [Caulobacterales bacterium]